MTALLPNTSVRSKAPTPDPATTLETVATTLMLLTTVAILYWAREILVPIAIAILMSFVLSPPIRLLRSFGIGKTLAVGTVVFLSFAVAVGLGAILAKQISDLASEAPRYQTTVTHKVDVVRDFLANNPVLERLNGVAADIARVAPKEEDKRAVPAPAIFPAQQPRPEEKKPMPVEIVSPPPGVLTILQTVGGAAASPLATTAFVALFVIFILMQREDLRNRFIRLVGSGDLHRTTIAMNEAANRLSRYFLAQVLLNTSFGIVVAIALAILGVPSAMLWGIVATFMRFIPYFGSVGAAFFPVVMAAASSSGWGMAIETAVMFIILELITGQVVEPLVYGRNTGISPIAVVASATFWTWLWGPVGLVLSTPLTVCLVVMGRHVERLAFLDVILGDAPPLTPPESFYQRMLVGDASEIVDHAETFLRDNSLLTYCDSVAMKALLMAQDDVRRGALDERRQMKIRDAMRDLVDDLGDLETQTEAEPPAAPDTSENHLATREPSPQPATPVGPDWARPGAVLCVAGRTPLDEAAAHLLADLLSQQGIGVSVLPSEALATPQRLETEDRRPELLILSFLDADLSVAQARFAVRRLRRRVPDVPLIAAFWSDVDNDARLNGLCAEVRAETCAASLPQALRLCLERATGNRVAEAA